jgi:IMP dehydrogenase
MKKSIRKTYTFDDVLLALSALEGFTLPGRDLHQDYQEHNPEDSVLSAAMDTVTESGLAIAIAREGGIGIIHKNLSIEAQANEVRLVKRAESGVITSPYTISPDDHLKKVMEPKKQHRIGGFPVVKDGKLVGILTNRDIRLREQPEPKS